MATTTKDIRKRILKQREWNTLVLTTYSNRDTIYIRRLPMNNVSIDRVEHDGSGRAFIVRCYNSRTTGEVKSKRFYGFVRVCRVCGEEFWQQANRGEGLYCSRCSHRNISLGAYKSVRRIPYAGNCSWAYIAGFFDGEGYVAVGRDEVSVSMSQKPIAVLLEIQKFLLSEGISSYIYALKNSCWNLQLSNQYAVYKFIMKTQNHCVVKLDALWNARAIVWEKIKHDKGNSN